MKAMLRVVAVALVAVALIFIIAAMPLMMLVGLGLLRLEELLS